MTAVGAAASRLGYFEKTRLAEEHFLKKAMQVAAAARSEDIQRPYPVHVEPKWVQHQDVDYDPYYINPHTWKGMRTTREVPTFTPDDAYKVAASVQKSLAAQGIASVVTKRSDTHAEIQLRL